MSSVHEANSLVKVRSENVDRYTRNFLQQAVCELRFPTLMSLSGPKPPAALVDALRQDYPYLELGNEVTIGMGTQGNTNAHIFRAAKMNWVVTVKQSAIIVETTGYTEYAQMRKRVLAVVEAAANVIDSDFFTRIGLRYINVIDANSDPKDGWINPTLLGPLASGEFSGVREFAGKLQLEADDGGITLHHGIGFRAGKMVRPEYPDYTLDIDSFRNEVPVSEAAAALDSIHGQAFDMFDWAIGPKSREYLTTKPAKK